MSPTLWFPQWQKYYLLGVPCVKKNNVFLVQRFAFKRWGELLAASKIPFLPSIWKPCMYLEIHSYIFEQSSYRQTSKQVSVAAIHCQLINAFSCTAACGLGLTALQAVWTKPTTASIKCSPHFQATDATVKQLLTREGCWATSSFWLCVMSTQSCPGESKRVKSFIYCR